MTKRKNKCFIFIWIVVSALILVSCKETGTETAIESKRAVIGSVEREVESRTQTETQEGRILTPEQRGYHAQPRDENQDVVTLMVYLCGSDLESQDGTATTDFEEIMSADISGNLNIIVETGGAKKWHNDVFNADTNERWRITSNHYELLADVGIRDMSSGDTLTDFISYSAENFPADRYMLVLWDHGGGTVGGYADDERFDDDEMMPVSELGQALAEAGVDFDMIGFDSCLMGTAETAFMAAKYADYMVASQRSIPGDGWNYTPWINALSQKPSIPTDELGKIIVDSFIEACEDDYYGKELTMAVINLAYIPALFETLGSFFADAGVSLVDDSTFIAASQALGQSRAVSDDEDLVDLVYLIESLGGSDEISDGLKQCVVYNGTTIEDHNGLCLYLPYRDLSQVSQALEIYEQLGIDETYQSFITTFANLMAGGQVYQGDGSGAYGSLAEIDWFDENAYEAYENFYEQNSYNESELSISEKGDYFVLSLSDEDWELITTVEQRVFLDDEDGFIDLGSDSVYSYDEDGDLIIEFDNTWVALDGELVCYYTMEDVVDGDTWYNWGIVPVLYDDKDAELIVRWDDQNPDGYVAGWRYVNSGGSRQKGFFEFQDGMRFDILCDFYTYDDEFDGQYLWGEIIIDGPLEVSYEDVGDADCEVYYELYDIYQNTYWTESVIYTFD